MDSHDHDNLDRTQLGEQLSAYLDGELSAAQREAVEAVLAEDAEARALLDDLRQTAAQLAAVPQTPAPESVLGEINSQLERAQLLGDADRNVTLARHKSRPLRSTVAVAAMVAIAIGGGAYVSLQLAATDKAGPQRVAMETPPAPAAEPLAASPKEKRTLELFDRARELEAQFDMAQNAEEMASPDASTPAADVPSARSAGKGGRLGLATKSVEKPGIERMARLPQVDADEPVEADDAVVEFFDRLASTETGTAGVAPAVAELNFGMRAAEEAGAARPMAAKDASRDAAPAPTLEQQLRGGENLDVVRRHDFAVEPLRLVLAFSDSAASEAYAQHLLAVCRRAGAGPLERTLRAGDVMFGLDVSQIWAMETPAEEPPIEQRLYFAGAPTVNFTPDNANERQYLLRLSPATIEALLAAADPAGVQLSLGGLVAEDPTQVRGLVGLLGGRSVTTEGDGANRSRTDARPDVDLLDMLRDLGVVPPTAMFGAAEHSVTRVAPSEAAAATDKLVTLVVVLRSAPAADARLGP